MRLVYRQGEPFFKQNKQYAKAIEIRFYDHKRRALPSIIALKCDDSGWTAHLERKAKFPWKVGLKNPTDMDQLVGRVNDALRQKQEYDLGSNIGDWRIFVETDRCMIELQSDLSNIVPPPNTLSSDHIFLVHQNGQPIFLRNNETGRRVVFCFGECWLYDYEYRYVVRFSMRIRCLPTKEFPLIRGITIMGHLSGLILEETQTG